MEENNEKSKVKVIDLDNVGYDPHNLLFLRKKLDSFTLNVFREVVRFSKQSGLLKTKIVDFDDHRKQYDAAFLILESQGFIEKKIIGNRRPYFVTYRGLQLVALLSDEKKKAQQANEETF